MRNIADVIEQFIISELFANDEDSINVKRSQLAEKLSCAPSQITYTLTTRFTPDKGFEVESKRGNGDSSVLSVCLRNGLLKTLLAASN
ncbi:CtsR family transcriptional regulator [Acidaminococcus intestini]|nr:CtsR family transcriptional regulator [Acidaminococcus intestini]